jgi:hypothetical protein
MGFVLKRAIQFNSAYERRIDRARILVAFAFGVCGAGLVICANVAESRETFGTDAELWNMTAGVFFIGMLLCLAATLILIVEGVVRLCLKWWGGRPLQFSLFTLLIVMTLVAVLCGMVATIASLPSAR